MNTYCRIVLCLTFLGIAGIALYPPRETLDGKSLLPRDFLYATHLYEANYQGWDENTSPPGIRSYRVAFDAARISTSRLSCELLLTTAVAGFLLVPFWPRRSAAASSS
jgi:hypothetical protein